MKTESNYETHTETATDTDPDTDPNDTQSYDGAACFYPRLGAKLPDYIVNLLDEDQAFEVERHLARCNYCKQKYLLVLRVQKAAALRTRNNLTNKGAGTLSNESLEDLEVGNHRD